MRILLTTLLIAFASLSSSTNSTAETTHHPRSVVAADSATILYQQARRSLDAGDLAAALPLFDRVWMGYRASSEAPKALYWKAFALYRRGGAEDFQIAERMLVLLDAWYPSASEQGDGAALLARVRGRLSASNRTCAPESQARTIAAMNEAQRGARGEALAAVRRALSETGECAQPVREQAAKALGKLGGLDAETTLVRLARDEQRTEVGYAALTWIAGHETARSDTLLTTLARGSTDLRTLETVVGALSRINAMWASDELRAIVQRPTAPAAARDFAEHILERRIKKQ